MRRKFHVFLLSVTLSAGILTTQLNSTVVDARNKTFYQQVSMDTYQKAITKGFLGRAYGVGGGRYICNTYVEKALENVANDDLKKEGIAFKDVKITKGKKGTPTSYDWKSYRVRFTYTDSVYDKKDKSYHWNTESTVTILNKKNRGTKKNKLELGDVLTYGGSNSHVALYFGKYDSKKEVMKRLVELGVYKPSELKKKRDRYVNKKGRPIIREYEGGGTHWRIHATYKGLLIDNAIVSKRSNGTSSFGRWTKAIPTGFTVCNEFSNKLIKSNTP